MNVRHPSLELGWLPSSERKGMPTPEIRFVDCVWASGYYLRRGMRNEGLEHTGRGDVLVISTSHGARPSTIAHEFRHMAQTYVPSLPRIGYSAPLDFGDTFETWCAAIRVFYRRPWEFDALRFESHLSPDETNENAMRALREKAIPA